MSLFVDTSAFFAVADRADRHNARAKSLLSAGDELVTTDHVLVETWLLTSRQLGDEAANRSWQTMSSSARIELVDDVDLELAWQIGEEFADQGFSIVDRTSFAVMQRLRLLKAVSFDHHFAIYRFGSKRDRAFEIVR